MLQEARHETKKLKKPQNVFVIVISPVTGFTNLFLLS